MSRDLVQQRIEEAVRVTRSLSEPAQIETALAIADAIVASLRQGGKVLFGGNGGSAADAQHLAGEFVGRFLLDRRPLPAICLTDNIAAVTAIANDYAYPDVLPRTVRALGSSGDVLIAMSTSGTSANVLAALDAGKSMGLTTVAFVGRNVVAVSDLADLVVSIDGSSTASIQQAHVMLGHIICEIVERTLCG